MTKSTNIFVHDEVERTIVVVDLVRYSDIVKSLQMGQKLGANATLLINNQIQTLIRQALDACGATPECFVKSTGDGAILQFESPTVAEHFAAVLHQLSFDQHCKSATSAYEWRSFRVGIFTGEVVLSPGEIAGAVVGFAKRLEAAAGAGEIMIDTASWSQIPPKQQACYGPKEVLQIKSHDPLFAIHRRQVVASPRWENATLRYLNRILNWAFELLRRQKRRWIAVGLILLFVAAFMGALTLKRKFESGAIAEARLHSAQGDALFDKNKFVEAEAEFRNAIKFDPKDSRYYFKLAEAMFEGNHNFPEVQTELVRGEAVARESILSDPQNAVHHHALARLLSAQRRDAEAEAAFREAIRLNPSDPEYHHDFAIFGLYQQDKFYEAESEVREAIRLRPYFDYFDSLAQILEATENYIEAEVVSRRAIDLNTEPYWTYEHLGYILWDQEKCKPGIRSLYTSSQPQSKKRFLPKRTWQRIWRPREICRGRVEVSKSNRIGSYVPYLSL